MHYYYYYYYYYHYHYYYYDDDHYYYYYYYQPTTPLRCNLGVYPLARRTGTQAHRSLFYYRRTAVDRTLLEL